MEIYFFCTNKLNSDIIDGRVFFPPCDKNIIGKAWWIRPENKEKQEKIIDILERYGVAYEEEGELEDE